MVKVISSANDTLAILGDVWNTTLSEGLNREFTFDFSTVIDGDKSQYITTSNKIEVENNYFNIKYFRKNRTMEGITLDVQCEHVSYELITANFTAGFTATGLFSAVATTLLSGTGFTVGTVQVTGNETISINESTNAFSVLKRLATLYNGELQFNKYQVNLLTQRGSNRGVQFRYRKNISNATVTVDGRQKTAGLPKTVYEVGATELEFEQGYIADGVSSLEHFELGDTILVIDDDLGINNSLRIVKHSYDPEQRMQGTVEISNFVDDLADTISNIQTTTIVKDREYNKVSLGPELGFVATRSDNKARAIMNATDGVKIQKGDGAGNWTDVIYLDTSGNGTFSGFVLASQFIGGSIAIGSGNNIFKADSNGIYLGNATFGSAPFRVTMSGALTATNGDFTGTIAATGGTFSGNISASGTIKGGTILGATIKTASAGESIQLTGNTLKTYNASNNLNGMVMEGNTSSTFTYGDLYFYDNGTKVLEIYNNLTGAGYSIRPAGSAALYLGTSGKTTYPEGTWNFTNCTITNLGATGTIYTTASQTITVTNGIITNIA